MPLPHSLLKSAIVLSPVRGGGFAPLPPSLDPPADGMLGRFMRTLNGDLSADLYGSSCHALSAN
jgi:hypothetical protein